ncbi:MAG: LexA repressor [Alphaproteobacteria bacterium MarineAlpha4_Bin2]|nr:MAG: LexA repressor [Alphaproteobacteria bacterium MarineAlpha4_Bin2]
MLTRKQHQLLMYIHEMMETQGVSPSFDEMKDALKLKSKSGIHRLIMGLEERGFLRRLPHRARALEILRLPDNVNPVERTRPGFAPRLVGVTRPEEPMLAEFPIVATMTQTFNLPLYGRIAAGTPIEALRDETSTIEVPHGFVGLGEHYALEVEGDSMVDAGIHDGDHVIILRCSDAENGAIVVALVDQEEVTLKRLRRKGASIALEPANKSYETRIFGPDRVRVQGRLVGLLRKY